MARQLQNKTTVFPTKNLLMIIFLMFLGIAWTLPVFAESYRPYADGQVIVKYKSNISAQSLESVERQVIAGRTRLRDFKKSGLQVMKLGRDERVADVVSELEKNPDIEYAEPNYYIYATGLPNDPDFEKLWALHNTGQEVRGSAGDEDADIDAPEAWDIETGSRNVVIAVLDTGIDYRHPDLAENIWQNPDEIPDNSTDDDGNGFVDDHQGWDFTQEDNDPMDFLGHGTDMAGIIGAVGDNGTGVTGVAWKASLMNVKVMDAFGVGTTAQAIAGIEYAAENGARIINASWGDRQYSQAMKDTIASFDGLFVTAAGNFGNNTEDDPLYPGSYDLDNIVTTAASDMSDQLLPSSNFGRQSVDLAAPGKNNYTTIMIRDTLWEDDFEDGDIRDWQTGGTPDSWGLESGDAISGDFSIANSPGSQYSPDSDNWIMAPAFDASQSKGTRLEFKLSGKAQHEHDFLFMEVSRNKIDWGRQDFYVPGAGSVSDFSDSAKERTVFADLSAYDGDDPLYFRFRFTSDSETQDSGWIIDDVKLTSVSDSYDGSEYGYKGGSSAATSYVSGVAGLLLSSNPALTTPDVKTALLHSVDQNSNLDDKVVSGGRLNAVNAIRYPDADGDDTTDDEDEAHQGDGGGGGCFVAIMSR